MKVGETAIEEEIKKEGCGGYVVDASNIKVMALDLSSLSSIKEFASQFLANENRLDFLVLNAGIMALPKLEFTDAGFEKQIGVNHFGHFYLTQLLQKKIQETPNTSGRIVVLTSVAHKHGEIVSEDLHYTKGRQYNGWKSYGQSKLANLLYAKALADRLKGTNITAVAVHPGVIQTNLWNQSLISKLIGNLITSKTIPQGAATTIFACVAPRVGTDCLRGAYLEDCSPSLPSKSGQDEDKILRNKLWTATEEQLAFATKKAGL